MRKIAGAIIVVISVCWIFAETYLTAKAGVLSLLTRPLLYTCNAEVLFKSEGELNVASSVCRFLFSPIARGSDGGVYFTLASGRVWGDSYQSIHRSYLFAFRSDYCGTPFGDIVFPPETLDDNWELIVAEEPGYREAGCNGGTLPEASWFQNASIDSLRFELTKVAARKDQWHNERYRRFLIKEIEERENGNP